MAEAKNIYQKILDITDEIGKIEKTGRNTQQGYAFIEQAKIVGELRPLLKKHGLVILPEVTSRNIERYTNSKGNIAVHANVGMRFTLVNADDPKETVTCEWDAGEAIDSSDKASNKAVTASNKYYLMKLFNISDKDDADSDSPELSGTPQPVYSNSNPNEMSEKQKNWLEKIAKTNGYADIQVMANEHINRNVKTVSDAKQLIDTLMQEGIIEER